MGFLAITADGVGGGWCPAPQPLIVGEGAPPRNARGFHEQSFRLLLVQLQQAGLTPNLNLTVHLSPWLKFCPQPFGVNPEGLASEFR